MLPPSPFLFPLWGAAVWAGFAASLWQTLATPWLAPGWPAHGCGAPPPGAGAGLAAPAGAIPDPESHASAAPRGSVDHPDGGGQVIRVPYARWRERRG